MLSPAVHVQSQRCTVFLSLAAIQDARRLCTPCIAWHWSTFRRTPHPSQPASARTACCADCTAALLLYRRGWTRGAVRRLRRGAGGGAGGSAPLHMQVWVANLKGTFDTHQQIIGACAWGLPSNCERWLRSLGCTVLPHCFRCSAVLCRVPG